MPADFVFPSGNEQEFAKMAALLGYDSLFFIYSYPANVESIRENLSKLAIKADFAFLCVSKDIQKARKFTKHLLIKNANRAAIEQHKEIIIYNLEETGKKDFIHHRSSGLNHILCKIAKQNNISVAFSFNLVLKADARSRARIIGRIKQNLRLCEKFKVRTLIASFAKTPFEMRSYKDLQSFLISTKIK